MTLTCACTPLHLKGPSHLRGHPRYVPLLHNTAILDMDAGVCQFILPIMPIAENSSRSLELGIITHLQVAPLCCAGGPHVACHSHVPAALGVQNCVCLSAYVFGAAWSFR